MLQNLDNNCRKRFTLWNFGKPRECIFLICVFISIVQSEKTREEKSWHISAICTCQRIVTPTSYTVVKNYREVNSVASDCYWNKFQTGTAFLFAYTFYPLLQFYGALWLELGGEQRTMGQVIFGSDAGEMGELQARLGIFNYGG